MSIKISGARTSSAARAVVLSMAVLGISTSAFADSATWLQAGVDGAWNNGANWDTGNAPGVVGTTTNTDTATFGRNTTGVNSTVVIDANRNIQNITLNPAVAGSTTFSYAFTGGPLVLTDGGTIAAGALGNTGLGSSSFANSFTLAGSYTLSADFASTNRLLTVSGSVTGPASTAGTLTLTGSSGGTHVLSGVVANGSGGTLALVKNGTNTWSLTNANTFTGGITVNSGLLLLGAGSGSTGGLTITGGQVTFNNGAGAASLGSAGITALGGTLSLANNANIFVTNTTTLSGANANLNLSTSNISAGFAGQFVGSADQSLTIVGTNAVNLSTSGKQLNGLLGTVNVSAGSTLSFRSTTVNNGGDSATFNVLGTLNTRNGGALSLGALTGTGTVTSGASGSNGTTLAYTIGSKNVNATFSGSITDADTANAKRVSITKTGTGSQTLAGPSTYTGGTTVNDGKLVTGNTSALGAGTVALTGTGTLKLGDGTVNTVAGLTGLTAADGTTIELASTGSQAALASGTFSLGNINLNLNNLFSSVGNYTIIDGVDGANAIGTTTFVNGTSGFNYAFNVVGNDGVLSVTAGGPVPEPASLAALGLAGVAVLGRRRKA